MNHHRNLKPLFVLAVLLPACALASRQGELDGIDMDKTLCMELSLPEERYSQTQQSNVARRIVEQLSALPRVTAAAAIDVLPTSLNCQTRTLTTESASTPQSAAGIRYNVITPDYFRAVRIPLLKGRSFTESDTSDSPPVTMISEALARQIFPSEDPIGKRISLVNGKDSPKWLVVVGVAGDVKDSGGTSRSGIYVAYSQHPLSTVSLLLRASSDPKDLIDIVEREIRLIDPQITVTNARTFSK